MRSILKTHGFLLIYMVGINMGIAQNNLQQALSTYIASLPPTTKVNMQVESIKGKVYFAQSPIEKVPSASIIKIPILATLMQDVKNGKINLDDVYLLRNADKVGGAGAIMQNPEQTTITYRQLAREMIVSSDNTAPIFLSEP